MKRYLRALFELFAAATFFWVSYSGFQGVHDWDPVNVSQSPTRAMAVGFFIAGVIASFFFIRSAVEIWKNRLR